MTDQQNAAGVPAGWQLVPVEPTPEMLSKHSENTDGLDAFTARRDWTAMLAAAPQPEAAPARLSGRAAIVKAWNDLPDAWRCHPALKQLYKAAQECEDGEAPSPTPANPDAREAFEVHAEKRGLQLDEQLCGISGAGAAYVYAETVEAWEAWSAALATKAPAPAQQAVGEVVVTWDEHRTRILAVTRQDDEGRILSVIATAPKAAHAPAEG